MFNRSASLAMSTSVLKALPGKLDSKRHSPSILYIICACDSSWSYIIAICPLLICSLGISIPKEQKTIVYEIFQRSKWRVWYLLKCMRYSQEAMTIVYQIFQRSKWRLSMRYSKGTNNDYVWDIPNTNVCCCGFVLTLFQSATANKIDPERTQE